MQPAYRVSETSSTSGYDNLVLQGAVSGYRMFSTLFAPGTPGDLFPYCIVCPDGTWEIGRGYLTPGGLLSRDTIIDSSVSNTSPAKVNLPAGPKIVFCINATYDTLYPYEGMVKAPEGTADATPQIFLSGDYVDLVNGYTGDVELAAVTLHYVNGILAAVTPFTT